MKEIYLLRLVLANFKGIRSLDTNLSPAGADILGANATGKSTLFDAFTWCLFGKDSSDATDFAIKTRDANGEEIPHLDHSVTLLLDVRGGAIDVRRTFTRTLKEAWVKQKGSTAETYKGNTTEYMVDGIAVNKSKFDAEVAAIADATNFKAFTNPAFFFSRKADDQKRILFNLINAVTDTEVIERLGLGYIAEKMGDHTLDELKATVTAQKRKAEQAVRSLPDRIAEVERATPERPNVEALNLEKEMQEASLKCLAEEAPLDNRALRYDLTEEIKKLRGKMSDIEWKIKQDNRNAAERVNAQKLAIKKEYQERHAANLTELTAARSALTALRMTSDGKDYIESLRKKYDRLSAEWDTLAAGLHVCPITCEECNDAACRAKMDKEADARLDKIEEEMNNLRAKKSEAEAQEKKVADDIARKESEVKAIEARYDDLVEEEKKRLSECVEPQPVSADVIPEWLQLKEQADAKQAQLDTMTDTTASNSRAAKRKEITDRIAAIAVELSKVATIKELEERKAELAASEATLRAEVDDCDRVLCDIDTITRAKMEAVTDAVNALFPTLRFAFFKEQLNGGIAPTCEASVDGVPYDSLNTAAKVNAGLELIDALGAHYGVFLPIFIDNAEGVNDIRKTRAQQLRLRVTDHKELTIVNN